MARNNDPGKLLGTTRMPQASVIENLAVPHIGAQRRESQGDNYRRMASSLGRLSDALMSFGAGVSKWQKAEEKDDGDLLKSLSSGTYSPEVRHEVFTETGGRDPVLESIETADDWVARGRPELQRRWEAKFKQYAADGWVIRYKEGDELPVDEDGYQAKVGDVKDVIRPEDIDDEILAEGKTYFERFQGKTTVKRMLRDQIGRDLVGIRTDGNSALSKYRREERTSRFESVYQNQSAAMILDPANDKVAPNELVKAVDAYGTQLANEVNADISDPKTRHRAAIRGLGVVMGNIDVDNPVTEDEVRMAKRVIGFLEGTIPNTGQSSLTHKEFAESSSGIVRRAKDVIARAEYDKQAAVRKAELYKLIKDKRNPKFENLPEVKVDGGTRVFKLTDSDVIESIAAERDTRANQDSTGAPLDVDEKHFFANIVDEQRGSPIASPALKGIFEHFSIGTAIANGDIDERTEEGLLAYSALRDKSPFDVRRYVDAEDRKALETIFLLSRNSGLSLTSAAQVYIERHQDFLAGGYANESSSIRKAIKADLKGEKWQDYEIDGMADAVAYSFLGQTRRPSHADVMRRLEKFKALRQSTVPEINGVPTRMPEGRGLEFANSLQAYLSDAKEFKRFKLDKSQYELEMSRDGLKYFLMSPDGGWHMDARGNPLYVAVSEVDDWYSEQQRIAAEAAEAKRKGKIKDANEKLQQDIDQSNADFQTDTKRRSAVKEFYRQRDLKVEEARKMRGDPTEEERRATRAPTWSATGPANYRRPTGKDVSDALSANKPDISVTPRDGPKFKAGDPNYRMPNKGDVKKAVKASSPKGDKTPKWMAGKSNYRLPKIGN